MNIVNLYENYNNYFNADLKAIFERCSKIALENNYKIYLIGGIVRDMILGRQNLDIDITVEGDAIEFARLLEKEGFVRVLSVHEDFSTAKVETIEFEGQKIDFASTRSESYKKAGHLPTVAEIGCSLEKDVKRRDFTINSLALSLNISDSGENFADLIDYVGGYEDLKSKKLRVLHCKSFIDDPTRIIRGLKYATRLSFDLEDNTFYLQQQYLKNVNYDMCYKRVKNELKLTFGLNLDECFKKFIEQKIYRLLCEKDIVIPQVSIEGLTTKYQVENVWMVYLGLILLKEDDVKAVLEKLELTKKEKNIVLNTQELLNEQKLEDDFAVYKAFEGVDVESLLVLAVLDGEKRQKVFRYLDFLREIKLSVGGNDLIEMGVAPSKKFTEAFDYVLRAKIENPSLDKEAQLKLLVEYLGL